MIWNAIMIECWKGLPKVMKKMKSMKEMVQRMSVLGCEFYHWCNWSTKCWSRWVEKSCFGCVACDQTNRACCWKLDLGNGVFSNRFDASGSECGYGDEVLIRMKMMTMNMKKWMTLKRICFCVFWSSRRLLESRSARLLWSRYFSLYGPCSNSKKRCLCMEWFGCWCFCCGKISHCWNCWIWSYRDMPGAEVSQTWWIWETGSWKMMWKCRLSWRYRD